MVDYRDLATVKQVAAEAPFITEATLRWWIFHAETNGLKPALLKIGGRLISTAPNSTSGWRASAWPPNR